MDAWIWWMIAAVVLGVLELMTITIFIFGPLAVAAAVTAVAGGLGADTAWQLAIFIVLALATMLALRPVARRHREPDPATATNVDALIGQEARTLERISSDALGLIRFDNANWTARVPDGAEAVPADTAVRVVAINGATAVVEPLTVHANPDSQEL